MHDCQNFRAERHRCAGGGKGCSGRGFQTENRSGEGVLFRKSGSGSQRRGRNSSCRHSAGAETLVCDQSAGTGQQGSGGTEASGVRKEQGGRSDCRSGKRDGRRYGIYHHQREIRVYHIADFEICKETEREDEHIRQDRPDCDKPCARYSDFPGGDVCCLRDCRDNSRHLCDRLDQRCVRCGDPGCSDQRTESNRCGGVPDRSDCKRYYRRSRCSAWICSSDGDSVSAAVYSGRLRLYGADRVRHGPCVP